MILGKDETNELDDTTLTAKAEYSINFTEQENKCCFEIYIVMEATVYLLMETKFINSRKKTPTEIHAHCVWIIFQKILQLMT